MIVPAGEVAEWFKAAVLKTYSATFSIF